eukprot:15479453-Alexandrium_andersonii.AAC.1
MINAVRRYERKNGSGKALRNRLGTWPRTRPCCRSSVGRSWVSRRLAWLQLLRHCRTRCSITNPRKKRIRGFRVEEL